MKNRLLDVALPDVNQKVRTNKLALCKKGFLKDKCQMQRKQKMRLSQLALVSRTITIRMRKGQGEH